MSETTIGAMVDMTKKPKTSLNVASPIVEIAIKKYLL